MNNGLSVYKANALVEASYKMNIDEIRVLTMILSEFEPDKPQQEFEFSIDEFLNKYPESQKNKNIYDQIANAISNLQCKLITLRDDEKMKIKVNLLTKQIYYKKNGAFKIVLHEDLIPFLITRKKEFTQYHLKSMSKFQSPHSFRMYELMAQFKAKECRNISIKDLKTWLKIENLYNRFGNLKARVIDPSINEINEKSDLDVSYTINKKGRSIDSILFRIKSKKSKLKIKLPPRPKVAKGSIQDQEWRKKCLELLNDNYGKNYEKLETEYLKKHVKYALVLGYKESAEELLKRGIKAYLKNGLVQFSQVKKELTAEEKSLLRIKKFEKEHGDITSNFEFFRKNYYFQTLEYCMDLLSVKEFYEKGIKLKSLFDTAPTE